MNASRSIVNFGGNIRFKPKHYYTPRTEAEVLEILDRHANGKVRVVGARHSWNAAMASDDAAVDLRHFNTVSVDRRADGELWATVGGGCRIKHVLQKLRRQARVTLPTMGLITEQTIAGAISTATHGSGRNSLSHYMEEIRIAAYDPETGQARLDTWNGGTELRAARCAVGCMGIILSVRFRCIPEYDVAETIVTCETLEDVLKDEPAFPIQQFYLIPHLGSFFVQRRVALPTSQSRRFGTAFLYRMYWLLGIDIGLHLLIKLLASVLKRPSWTRFFYRRLFSKLILRNVTVVDRAERMLVMEHELFKHLEMEVFVPASQLNDATNFICRVLDVFAGTASAESPDLNEALLSIGLAEELRTYRGSFTHHYPIAFRRVLPEDTLISMTSSSDEPYYAISFITYSEPRDDFLTMASFLARCMSRLFRTRLHWGKYFPLTGEETEAAYPRLLEFRVICERVDPRGVFRSAFVEQVLFGTPSATP